MRRGLYAVAALAEVYGVEVPLDYLPLVIFFLKLQRAEYLRQLSHDGDFVLAGEVLYELLGDGGAAVVVLHGGEHLHERAGGTVPVDALMLVKALVLDGDERLFHIPRDVLVVDPDAVLLSRERHQLLPVAPGVLVPDGAGLIELVVLERYVEVRREAGLYIVGKHEGEQHSRDEQHQKDRAEPLQHSTHHARGGVHRDIHGLEGKFPDLAGGAALIRAVFVFLGLHPRHRPPSGKDKICIILILQKSIITHNTGH